MYLTLSLFKKIVLGIYYITKNIFMIKYYSLKKELTSTKNPSTATPFGCPSPIVKLYKLLSL